MITPENTDKKQTTKFTKGQSGNPAGRPRGALNSATKAAMILFDGEIEVISRKLIEMAKKGDIQAIKLILERVVPARKDRPISIELPKIISAKTVMEANRQIIDSVAYGELTPSEGQSLMVMTENIRKSIDSREFEERMEALEKKFGHE